MESEVVIECTGLRCTYGKFEAVRGVDLTVARGELFALLGTNGAGKTTTLETLQGHRRPSGGTVRVLGLDPARQRHALAARVGVVLQESGFAPDLTVAETVLLWRRLAGGSGDRGAVAALLEEVHLAERAGIRVRQLSGGERRRLDLAVALVRDRDLLFLDEPTTGLDPQSRQQAWDVIRERLRRGTTVLLTTHYLEEAEALADRVAIMDRGRIVETGTLAEISGQRPARIRCTVPGGRAVPLHGLAGTAVWDGDELTVTTTDLQGDLAVLSAWAAGHGLRLTRLQATDASLNEVFQEIAGGMR